MSDYIPDTEEVSNMYSSPSWVTLAEESERYEEFDRWLDSVKAEAWDEGAAAVNGRLTLAADGSEVIDWESEEPFNPYRKEQHDE